jgi:hypothetical protein
VLPGDDMLDVERKEIGVVFVKLTVLTTAACPLTDKSSQGRVHHSPVA